MAPSINFSTRWGLLASRHALLTLRERTSSIYPVRSCVGFRTCRNVFFFLEMMNLLVPAENLTSIPRSSISYLVAHNNRVLRRMAVKSWALFYSPDKNFPRIISDFVVHRERVSLVRPLSHQYLLGCCILFIVNYFEYISKMGSVSVLGAIRLRGVYVLSLAW